MSANRRLFVTFSPEVEEIINRPLKPEARDEILHNKCECEEAFKRANEYNLARFFQSQGKAEQKEYILLSDIDACQSPPEQKKNAESADDACQARAKYATTR